jgi:hypothetical protein
MARATRLRIYETDTPAEPGGEQPTREAFPAPPPPIDPRSQHADDVLSLLRRETDHAISIATQANSVAAAAHESATRAVASTTELANHATALAARQTAVEARTQEVGRQAVEAIAQHHAAARQAGAAVATAAQQIAALLVQILAYALDRLPMLLTLAAAVWLWRQVLDDPSVLRLVGLALFGALVIAPALWLTAYKRGN